MNKLFFCLALFTLVISACSTDTPSPTPIAQATQPAASSKSPTALPPTATPSPRPPTATSSLIPPTVTPSPVPPTETPLPTPTDTATATPPPPTPTKIPIATVSNIEYILEDITKQKLDVYTPADQNGPFPTILAIHGGMGDKRDLTFMANYFARLSYAVVSINHRDWPNYTYPDHVQDAFCALAWVHSNTETYNFDPNRIYALGHSAGGTLAATLATVDNPAMYLEGCPHTLPASNWVQAAIPFTGIFDYAKATRNSLAMRNYVTELIGADQESNPDLWAEASPATWVDGSEPPFLLIHGAADQNIRPSNSENFAATLEEYNVPVQLELITGADHMDIVNDTKVFDIVDVFLQSLDTK